MAEVAASFYEVKVRKGATLFTKEAARRWSEEGAPPEILSLIAVQYAVLNRASARRLFEWAQSVAGYKFFLSQTSASQTEALAFYPILQR